MAKIKVKVKGDTENVDKLLKKINKLSKAPTQVKVGFPEEQQYPDGTSLLTVAASNEFGTADGRIPERSFLRVGLQEKKNMFKQLWRKKLAKQLLEGTITPKVALNILGLQGETIVKNKIRSLRTPANAQSTIDAKGSSNPLIDTGFMIQSVRFQVDE